MMSAPCFDSHNFTDPVPREPDLESALDAVTGTCDFCDGLGREPSHKTCRICGGAGYYEIKPPGAQTDHSTAFFFRREA